MSRRCDLTGKTAQVGHKVSHSNRKTKRRFLPNLLNVTMMSDALGRSVRLKVSAPEMAVAMDRGRIMAGVRGVKASQGTGSNHRNDAFAPEIGDNQPFPVAMP